MSAPEAAARSRRKSRVLPGLLGRHAAAEFCGDQGVSTWDRNTAAGLTPAPVRIAGSVFWVRAELAEWCLRGCPPRDEWAPLWRAILARRDAKSGR